MKITFEYATNLRYKIKALTAKVNVYESGDAYVRLQKLLETSKKAAEEKREILRRLMTSPVMNVDFTNANGNGTSAQVLVLASPMNHAALYIGKEKKGHQGIEGTPLADYVGTIVHDHALEFYRYGSRHQECIRHGCRYLIGSKENEP